MHDLYENLEQLCETVAEEIREANNKIKTAGGKISAGDVEYLDKLTHMLKSIKTTKAMMDSEEGYSSEGYSNEGMSGASYARGRGRNARRDSRGRYSSEGMSGRSGRSGGRSNDGSYESYGRSYGSYGDEMVDELRELMNEAPNNEIRQKFQKLISEIENMR